MDDDSVAGVPLHTMDPDAVRFIEGATETVANAVSEQAPFATTTEYDVAAVGATDITDVVCPVFQRYVLPPPAVRLLLLPAHTVVLPLMVAVGVFETFTVATALPVQTPLTTVTV